jgi:hypothetical protein
MLATLAALVSIDLATSTCFHHLLARANHVIVTDIHWDPKVKAPEIKETREVGRLHAATMYVPQSTKASVSISDAEEVKIGRLPHDIWKTATVVNTITTKIAHKSRSNAQRSLANLPEATHGTTAPTHQDTTASSAPTTVSSKELSATPSADDDFNPLVDTMKNDRTGLKRGDVYVAVFPNNNLAFLLGADLAKEDEVGLIEPIDSAALTKSTNTAIIPVSSPEFVIADVDPTTTALVEEFADQVSTGFVESVADPASPEYIEAVTEPASPRFFKAGSNQSSSESANEVASSASPEFIKTVADQAMSPESVNAVPIPMSPGFIIAVADQASSPESKAVASPASTRFVEAVADQSSPGCVDSIAELASPGFVKVVAEPASPGFIKAIASHTSSPESVKALACSAPPDFIKEFANPASPGFVDSINDPTSSPDPLPSSGKVAESSEETGYQMMGHVASIVDGLSPFDDVKKGDSIEIFQADRQYGGTNFAPLLLKENIITVFLKI